MLKAKASELDIHRLDSAKDFCVKNGSAISFCGSVEDGGVVYIHPNVDIKEIRKSLLLLAIELSGESNA